jgi:carbonic anhydrase
VLSNPRRLSVCVVSALCLGTAVYAQGADPANVPAAAALQRLQDGNKRFVEGKATHEHQQASRRTEIAKGQNPFAIIVCCSDSRVPPEVVFDQGLGDIFVVRTAGNVLDEMGLGSVEYAVEHFGTQLVVVLGHDHCGAVRAAVAGGKADGHVQAIIEAIRPAVEKAKGQPGDLAENAMRANVNGVVQKLSTTDPVLPHRVETGKLTIVGARYDLDDGHVELIK